MKSYEKNELISHESVLSFLQNSNKNDQELERNNIQKKIKSTKEIIKKCNDLLVFFKDQDAILEQSLEEVFDTQKK